MAILHPASWVHLLVLVVAVTLALLALLCLRLRQNFPATWDELGRPFSLERYLQWSWWGRNEMAEQKAQFELLFFIFSGQHQQLRDRSVTMLVWLLRLACLPIIALSLLAMSNVPMEWHNPWGR
jgi:hypothetical protein